jgi:hypothetical protein
VSLSGTLDQDLRVGKERERELTEVTPAARSRQLGCQRQDCSGGPGGRWCGVRGAARLGEVERVVHGLILF